MAAPLLVISHPPHGEVDPELAAPVLGICSVDVRLKAHHAVPEIWLALDDHAAARAAAEVLGEAHLRVVAVPATVLAAIPPHRPICAFECGEIGLKVQDERGDDMLPYDASLVAVLFTPRLADPKALHPPSFLDLYTTPAGLPVRWTVLQGVTGFGGMGRRQTASFGTNVHAFAADVEARFPKVALDRRLEHMRVRRHAGVPPPGVMRHGYSFATAALNQLLDTIRPGLSAIDDEDLSSRLAYLTHAGA